MEGKGFLCTGWTELRGFFFLSFFLSFFEMDGWMDGGGFSWKKQAVLVGVGVVG